MKKILTGVTLIILLSLITGLTCWARGPGTTGANFLKIGIGARAEALGGAYTALSDDGSALYWNPAGLAQLKEKEFFATYNVWFQGISQGYLSFSFPSLKGVLAAGVNYINMGELEKRDQWGNPEGIFSASDLYLSLGYAREISPGLMLGLSGGYLEDTIAEDKKSTFLGNIGVMIKPTSNISLGASAQNIGSNLGEDDLPLILRAGAALKVLSSTLSFDAVFPNDNDSYYAAGIEYPLSSFFTLRAGYRTGKDAGEGYSAGLGFNLSSVSLDYAYVPYGDLGNSHRVSLGMRF